MIRYLICFSVLFSGFMFLMSPTPTDDMANFQRAQTEYEIVKTGKITTLSGVNFYQHKRGGIFYRPGGSDFQIRCIRCVINFKKSKIKELDFVTLPEGGKIAVGARLASGVALLTREEAVREIQYIRDHYRNMVIRSADRNDRSIKQIILSAFVSLSITGLYALSRLEQWVVNRKKPIP